MFSLPYPGYLQQNRDNGGLLVHGLCAPEKWRGKCSGAFFVCVCLSFLSWQGTLTICVQLWPLRQNFWVVCRGEWVGERVSFYFRFCLILLFKFLHWNLLLCGLQKGNNLRRITKLMDNLITSIWHCFLIPFTNLPVMWFLQVYFILSTLFSQQTCGKLFFVVFICSRQQIYLHLLVYCFNVEKDIVDSVAVHGCGGKFFISQGRVTGVFVAEAQDQRIGNLHSDLTG